MRRSPLLITGLTLSAALGVLDLAGLAGLFVDPAPPAAIVIAGALLGVATLASVPAAWRGHRTATVIAVATRVLSALLSVPAFFTPDAPGWAKLAIPSGPP
ncbi:MAG: hypothetical protein HOV96_11920 [Nonomuraea sp.]|nr:hypothetical protein [Nonomuraea sp.]NUP62781.1 hypothetical protein [Nonomuraea sp.]NUP78241.1 hypothetical protein [Nonomuraea sp.]